MTTSKRWMIWSAVATVVLASHFAFEFAAWASHPGNSAVGRGSCIPWEIASFPLFLLVGHKDAFMHFFWGAMVANSLIWSAGLTLIAKRVFGTD